MTIPKPQRLLMLVSLMLQIMNGSAMELQNMTLLNKH